MMHSFYKFEFRRNLRPHSCVIYFCIMQLLLYPHDTAVGKKSARDVAVIDCGLTHRNNNRPWHVIMHHGNYYCGYCSIYPGIFLFVLLHPSSNKLLVFRITLKAFLILSWHHYSSMLYFIKKM